MNRIIYPGLSLLLFLFILSCSKRELRTKEDGKKSVLSELFGDEEDELGEILVKLETSENDPNVYADLHGAFRDAEGTGLTVESFTINSTAINQSGEDENYYYRHLDHQSEGYEDFVGPLAGNSTLTISTTGGSFGDLSETIEMAVVKTPTFGGVTDGEISKSAGFTVSWTPSEAADNLYLVVRYEGAKSNDENPELPAENQVKILTIPDDNGEFTVNAEDLNELPIGGYISLSFINAVDMKEGISTSGQKVGIVTSSFFHSSSYRLIE